MFPSPTPCIASNSDPNNCGRCGHSCQGGICWFGTCQPVVLANNVCPTSLALDDTNVYFTDNRLSCSYGGCDDRAGVSKVAKAGGLATWVTWDDSYPPHDPFVTADGIAVYSGSIFWVRWTPNSAELVKVSAVGGTPVPIAGGAAISPRQVTRSVAANANGVFWANEALGLTRVTTSSVATIATAFFTYGGNNVATDPSTLAVDGLNAYFTINDSPFMPANVLNSVPIGGGSATSLGSVPDVLSPPVPSTDTAIATDGTHVYWASTDQAPGLIFRVPVSGGAMKTFTGTIDPNGTVTSLTVDASGLYWTEHEASGRVAAAPLSGGAGHALAGGQNYPLAVAADDKAVYWVNAGRNYSTMNNNPYNAPCTGSVMKIAK